LVTEEEEEGTGGQGEAEEGVVEEVAVGSDRVREGRREVEEG
jgi:hypothetical protein